MPIASSGVTNEGEYTFTSDVLYLDLAANGAVERPKQVLAPEVPAHGFLKGDVVGDHITQLHSNPPKLNSATSAGCRDVLSSAKADGGRQLDHRLG